MDGAEAARDVKRYERAKEKRDRWLDDWEDCYDLGFPGRDSFYQESPGESRTEDIYDDTVIGALQDFSGLVTDGIFGGEFIRLVPGWGVQLPPRDRLAMQQEIDEQMTFLLQMLRNSNFDIMADEKALDLAIGTGVDGIRPSDNHEFIDCEAIPLHQVTLDRGPHGDIDGIFRCQDIEQAHIKVKWPKAVIPDANRVEPERASETKLKVLEACYRDWNSKEECYVYHVIDYKAKETLWKTKYKGMGSKPWNASRWSAASGEIYGRGPLLNALNSVRGINLLKRLLFENADMEIGGVWRIENDGMVNVDTITIESGMIIPHMPNSRGLEKISSSANFDLSQFIMEDEKATIRRALYVEDYSGKGQTPISAEEVGGRRMMLAKRLGGPSARLFREWVVRVIQRVVYIGKQQGILNLPRLDGREVSLVATSPLARADAFEAVQRKAQAMQMAAGILGEGVVQTVDLKAVVKDIFMLMEQPMSYIIEQAQSDPASMAASLVDNGMTQGGQVVNLGG